MGTQNTTLSLQLLMLNDLLNQEVIDKDIYERATQKIETIVKDK